MFEIETGNNTIEQNENQTCMSKGFIVIEILLSLLILLSLMWKNQILMNLVVLLSCGSIVLFSMSEGILLLFTIAVFETSVTFNGNGGWIFMVGILLLKGIYLSKAKLRADVFVPAAILLIIEILNEVFFYRLGGDVLGCIFLIGLLAVLAERKDIIRIDSWSALFCFGLSFLVITIYLLYSYGGLSEMLNQLMSQNNAFRLGTEQTTEFSGAMGIPLYSIMIVTLGLCFLFGKQKRIEQTIVAFCLILVAIFLGTMSVARSFYLAMVAVIICILCARGQTRKKITFVFIGFLIVFGVLYFYQPITEQILNNLQYRLNSDSTSTGGRTDIWIASLQYLSNHPIALLFGRGACGYQNIGRSEQYLFSAGCHNFFIDMLMSWGIVGFLCVIVLASKMINFKIIVQCFNRNVFSVVPLVGLLLFSMTALRTNSVKALVFYFVCICMLKMEGDGNLDT